MFDKKTILIGGSLVVLLLIVSGFLVWQVVDNHSKKVLINKQSEELSSVKDECNKLKDELAKQTGIPSVIQEEYKVEINSSSWRENVIDCLKNYPQVHNDFDYEATGDILKGVFLDNSYSVICNRLWHGPKILSYNLTKALGVDEKESILVSNIIPRDNNLYLILFTKHGSLLGYIQINTKTDKWEFKQDKKISQNFISNIQIPDHIGRYIYAKHTFPANSSTPYLYISLWVYDFFTDTDKKVYDVPNDYIIGSCGEGEKITDELKWINSTTIKFTLLKVFGYDSPLCKNEKGEYICGDCGESSDSRFSKEIILNNL